MKKDISFPPVQGISLAVTREKNELSQSFWQVYLLNKNNFSIRDVVIRATGYGVKDGEQQKTSTLTYHIPLVGPDNHTLVEPIDSSVFHLYNEYWISYFVENQIYDKKFIFVPESIIEENLVFIPQLNLEGILHK